MIKDIKEAFDKKSKEHIVLGFDLADDYSQISYAYMNDQEPTTVSAVLGGDEMCIPTMLAKYENENTWTFGFDARKLDEEGGGTVISNLLTLAKEKHPIKVEDKDYNPIDLLALYMKKCFSLLSLTAPIEKVSVIVITVDNADSLTIEVLSKAITTLRIKPEKVFFQNYSESAYNYIIHQNQELWTHDVLICHLKEDGMYTRSLKKYLNTSPTVMVMDEKNFSHIKAAELKGASEATKNKLDQAFCHILYGLCEDNHISSIFLLGKEFEGDWFKESLRYMSRGRRVFGGNNLFSKGAAYGARQKLEDYNENFRYVFLDKDKVKANIGLDAVIDGELSYLPLIDAGKNWYDSTREIQVILDNEDTLSFVITPLNGKNVKNELMYLTGIPTRAAKATRVLINIKMASERKMVVTVTDMGFGQFYPPSGLTWRQEIVLD